LTSGLDHAITAIQGDGPAVQEGHPAVPGQASGLPSMTPETARHLAALLAPHLVAMRAVTAGTRYEGCAGSQAGGGIPGAAPGLEPPVSPATRIFIAGMLELISA
jgi:hypothetical protein